MPRGYRTILPDGWNKETHHLSPQRYSDTALLHSAAFISTLGFLYIQYLQSSTLLSIQYLQFYTPGTFSELRVTHKHIFWINRKYTARCPAGHKYWLQWCCSAAAELLQAAVITQTFGKSSASNIFMLRDVEQNFHVISHNIFCSTPKYQRWGLSQISFKHVLPILNPEKPLQSMRCGDYLRSLHKDSFKV